MRDIAGHRFGRLVVLELTEKRADRKVVWLCLCDCGNTCEVRSSNLLSENTQSCGCYRKEKRVENGKVSAKDITNKRFGRLVVLEATHNRSRGSIIWKCLCDCGTICEISSKGLQWGTTQSCGCLNRELTKERRKIDLTNHRFGRLVALEPTDKRKCGSIVWRCICDCGTVCEVRSDQMSKGKTKSCGCLLCKGDVYLYFFKSLKTDLVKIGISGNIGQRRLALEEKLDDTFDIIFHKKSSRSEENTIHKQLKQYRAIHPNQPKGKEWFYPEPEVLNVAQGLQWTSID